MYSYRCKSILTIFGTKIFSVNSFLDLVADDVLKNHGPDFSETCIVFPTRRAGLIFRKKFAARLLKPAWSPEVMAIEDFINSLAVAEIAEDLPLLFELFEVYKTFYNDTRFEKFFHWGEILLKDFNELDLQLTDADKLFKNITGLKKIESEFGLAEEEAERIASFWEHFSSSELSTLKSAFKSNWESLPKIYHAFRKRLFEKGMSYEGMAYQEVLKNLKNKTIELKWSKVIFAGFYALNRSHEHIIAELTKQQKAILFWDADAYYTDDTTQEAGNYFRKKKLLTESIQWKGNYFTDIPKNIKMTGVPLQTGQAKYLGELIGKQMAGGNFSENNTAIVLPDENMLFPVLYSLPQELTAVNVTMGYPLKKSLVSGLVQSLYALQKHIREKTAGEIHFYSRDVIALFEHPYLHDLNARLLQDKINEYKRSNKIYISLAELLTEDEKSVKQIFRKVTSADDVFYYLSDILSVCVEAYRQQQHAARFDFEILDFVKKEIAALHETVKPYSDAMDADVAWQFIRKAIDTLKIPFSGEPVQGLQVMGFLETRALDFENLFILSVNEGVLPSASRGNSYIPFSLRKGFGLPAFDEQEAVMAYHFYRLLQRAKNIHIFYNTEVKSLTGGERSRFLLQLNYELKKKAGRNLKLHHSLVSTNIISQHIHAISIEKNAEVMKILEERFVKGVLNETPGFSASALSSYINCPLQFYFRYVARIREEESIEENIEADTFGRILHEAMHRLYTNVKELTTEKINTLLPSVKTVVTESFIQEFPQAKNDLEGKNYLLREVLFELTKRILEADKDLAPFYIETLEQSFEHTFTYDRAKPQVQLRGIFDRVDLTNGGARIVDYKTGGDELNNKKGFAEIFADPKLKATFQLYYYAYIYKELNADKKLRAGIYRMKSISDGLDYLEDGEEINKLKLQEFENHLEDLIAGIMNPTIVFSQTTDEKRCVYCPYREICNR